MDEKDLDTLNLKTVWHLLVAKKNNFFITWGIVAILSCLWIFPLPQYYTCQVTLAPEVAKEELGGIASIASSFGFSIGGASLDAIYPLLYPEVIASNDFVANLMTVNVQTLNGSISTNYYDYLVHHNKKSWIKAAKDAVLKFLSIKREAEHKVEDLNPFQLTDFDDAIFELAKKNIKCTIDKKTDIVTISVTDYDRLVCAILADSVREHLQDYIIQYKTSKARIDMEHYLELTQQAKDEYDEAMAQYSVFCEANQDVILQRTISTREKLKNDMQLKYTTYQAMQTQLTSVKARLQERTPSFTIIKSAAVPIKAAGPKRMEFVLGMLILATFVMIVIFTRNEIKKLFR